MTSAVRRALAAEGGTYRSLWLWARRRLDGLGPDDIPFGYAGVNAFAVWAFVGVGVVELPLIHFLVPWPAVRWVLLLGVWGLVWMVGYAASLRVHPHVVGPHGLCVRYGHTTEVHVPWDHVNGVRVRTRNYLDGAKLQVLHEPDGDVVAVTISNQTNVELALSRDLPVPGRRTEGARVREVRLMADDPDGLAAAVRARVSGARPA